MNAFRYSLICGATLALAALAGCEKEEPVQPPPPPAPADEQAAKPVKGRGYSTIDPSKSSSSFKEPGS